MLTALLNLLLITCAEVKGDDINSRWLKPFSKLSGAKEIGEEPAPVPFSFMVFPSGGKTETGLDLELLTKNAAVEANRLKAASANDGIDQSVDGSLKLELTNGLSRPFTQNSLAQQLGAVIPQEVPYLPFPSPISRFSTVQYPNIYKPMLLTRPGLPPLQTFNALAKQPFSHQFMPNNYEQNEKTEELVPFRKEPRVSVIEATRNERFLRNDSDESNPLLSNNYYYYGPEFYGAMMRLPFNYNNNHRWWPWSRLGTGAITDWRNNFRMVNLPVRSYPYRYNDYGVNGEKTLTRLNAVDFNENNNYSRIQ
ncbi:unnamed protein product [Thelazia callipaeda]|uniref:Uncharacterized protein n=1 Tax=Thelazia callipaeda TaxID=103827 RepID=A0A0N5D931_THECL|nr:unnamed protein product [Thelazia callipaeda]